MQNNIVLIWIWWAWMSSLAGLLLELWYTNIVWVDAVKSIKTSLLKKQWVTIHIWHGNYTVNPWDFVIYSQAAEEVIEVKQAREHTANDHVKSAPPMLYTQFLGEFSKYMKTIAITGTHGKSTTTWLLANTLSKIDSNFWVWIVWAKITDRNWSSYIINSDHKINIRSIMDHILFRKWPYVESLMKRYRFVIEACEYNRHFFHYDPDYAIITNCEIDHSASYDSLEDYYETFAQFIRKVRNTAYIPENPDIWLQYCLNTLESEHKNKIHQVSIKGFSFDHLLWWHNNINASLASDLLYQLHSNDVINQSLSSFKWLSRRAETIWKNKNWISIISDYWHHPTEIKSTLLALKEKYPNQAITAIFQPHQITRVVEFWDEFKDALALAENRILTPIFNAREAFEDIQARYPDHEIQKSSSLHAFNQSAWEYRDAKLVTNEEIVKNIQSINDGIIVYFTAGDLDELIKTSI